MVRLVSIHKVRHELNRLYANFIVAQIKHAYCAHLMEALKENGERLVSETVII